MASIKPVQCEGNEYMPRVGQASYRNYSVPVHRNAFRPAEHGRVGAMVEMTVELAGMTIMSVSSAEGGRCDA